MLHRCLFIDQLTAPLNQQQQDFDCFAGERHWLEVAQQTALRLMEKSRTVKGHGEVEGCTVVSLLRSPS